MTPENVHGYTFPNALTSFTLEERSEDHFTVVILSLVVFITSDETACQSANCHQPSYPAVQLTVQCCSVCGAVDLIDA